MTQPFASSEIPGNSFTPHQIQSLESFHGKWGITEHGPMAADYPDQLYGECESEIRMLEDLELMRQGKISELETFFASRTQKDVRVIKNPISGPGGFFHLENSYCVTSPAYWLKGKHYELEGPEYKIKSRPVTPVQAWPTPKNRPCPIPPLLCS